LFATVTAAKPYYERKGTGSFEGCIRGARDRSCRGDPALVAAVLMVVGRGEHASRRS